MIQVPKNNRKITGSEKQEAGKRLFPLSVPVRAREFGFARQIIQPSRPASACSFFTLRLHLICLVLTLTHGIPPLSATDGVGSFLHRRPPLGSVSRSSAHVVAYRRRSLTRVRRPRTTSSLQGSPRNGCCLSRHHRMDRFLCAFLLPHPLLLVYILLVVDITRFSLSMEISRLMTRDGTAEPVSRERILRHEPGSIFVFPVQLTTCRTGNLTQLIHALAICVTIYYIYMCDADAGRDCRTRLARTNSQARTGTRKNSFSRFS